LEHDIWNFIGVQSLSKRLTRLKHGQVISTLTLCQNIKTVYGVADEVEPCSWCNFLKKLKVRSVQCSLQFSRAPVVLRVLCLFLKTISVIYSNLRPVPENLVIHCPASSTLKTVKRNTNILTIEFEFSLACSPT